jgi:hypothetical protein
MDVPSIRCLLQREAIFTLDSTKGHRLFKRPRQTAAVYSKVLFVQIPDSVIRVNWLSLLDKGCFDRLHGIVRESAQNLCPVL